MSITFEPFKAHHLASLSDPDAAMLLAQESVFELEKHPSFTGRDGNGRILGCAGVHPIWWPGRWNAWAFLERETGPHMLAITRFVRFVLTHTDAPRIEAHVVAGFPQGMKFARALGFHLETPEPMIRWAPNGADVFQFARIR